MKTWLAIVFGLFITLLFIMVFVPQLWASFLLNHPVFSADLNPKLSLVPLPRPVLEGIDQSVSWPDIVAFGLQLTTPWGEPDAQRGVATRDFIFGNGNRLSLAKNQQPDAARLLLKVLGPRDTAGRQQAYGEANLDSNYELVNLILKTTPPVVGETLPTAQTAQVILLSMKGRYLRGFPDQGLSRFSTRDVGGFQFGDPPETRRVKIFFFDQHDHHYTMILSGRELTQTEVDFVLSSITVL